MARKKKDFKTRADCVKALEEIYNDMGITNSIIRPTDLVDLMFSEKRKILRDNQGLIDRDLPKFVQAKIQDELTAIARYKKIECIKLLTRDALFAEADQFKIDNPNLSFKEFLLGKLTGVGRFFEGNRASVSRARDGYLIGWSTALHEKIRAIAGGGKAGDDLVKRLLQDEDFFSMVIHAVYDLALPTGQKTKKFISKEARAVGEALEEYLELSRMQFNSKGGNVEKIPGYLPQYYSAFKLLEMGKDEFVSYMLPRLDHLKTFGKDMTPENKISFMESVYDNLTLGKNQFLNMIENNNYSKSADKHSYANANRAHRVLYYRDAEAYIEINKTLGDKSLMRAIADHFDQMANATAIVDVLGPEPIGMIKVLIEREKLKVKENTNLTQKEKDKLNKELKSMYSEDKVAGASGEIARAMFILTYGNRNPVSPKWAKAGSGLRAIHSLSKLGSATLSALTDLFNKAMVMRGHDSNYLFSFGRSVLDMFKNFGNDGQRREAAAQGGAFLRHLFGVSNDRMGDLDTVSEKLAWMQDKFHVMTGLTWWTEQGKKAAIYSLAEWFGNAHKLDFDQLSANQKSFLKQHKFGADDWNLMRKLAIKLDDGNYYINATAADRLLSDLDVIHLIPNRLQGSYKPESRLSRSEWTWEKQKAIKVAKDNFRAKVTGMFVDETRAMIIEPTDASTAWQTMGTRPGTAIGELWRCLMQFKSFPIAYWQNVVTRQKWMEPRLREKFANSSFAKRYFGDPTGLTGHLALLFMGGYLAYNLKEIAKGREPREMDGKMLLAAMAQSGGFGILGDFLFGESSRFGGSAVATVAGPTIGLFESIVRLWTDTRDLEGKKIARDVSDIVKTNTPFMNVWYSKEVMNYLLFYHIQEAISPGYLQRYKRRMKKENNQTYFVDPTEYIKHGGGFK